MKLVCNGLNLKSSKGNINGLPAIIIRGEPVKEGDTTAADALYAMLGADVKIENADSPPYRRVIITVNDRRLIVTAQDKYDREFLDRMVGQQIMCDDSGNGDGSVVIRPDPALIGKPREPDKFEALPLDDLLDFAARRGIAVPRNTLKSDLVKILNMQEIDQAKALEMAKNIKPAMEGGQHRLVTTTKESGGGGSYKTKTFNET